MRYETKALLLHKRPYRNTSLLLTFLTEAQGKVTLVCRGGQKKLDIAEYSTYWLDYVHNEGLGTLYKQELLTSIYLIGDRLISAMYLAELLLKCLPEGVAESSLYELTTQVITKLEQPSEALAPILRFYEHQLLSCLGIGLSYDLTALSEENIQSDHHYKLVLGLGFVSLEEAINYPQASRFEIKGDVLLALSKQDYSRQVTLKWAKALHRILIDHALEGKPLKSRQLIQEIYQHE